MGFARRNPSYGAQTTVIRAKAGTQAHTLGHSGSGKPHHRHSSESWNPFWSCRGDVVVSRVRFAYPGYNGERSVRSRQRV